MDGMLFAGRVWNRNETKCESDDEALGMNKIHVVCRLPETMLGFKEELCSMGTVI
jgi:hypothetical protein